MLLKDLLDELDEPRNETDAWISKYYALLTD